MAETAKMLNPDKTVLLPDLQAGCSLAESCTAEALAAAAVANGAPRRRARILDESSDLVRFPGDPGYEAVGTREALGWVWIPSHEGGFGTPEP